MIQIDFSVSNGYKGALLYIVRCSALRAPLALPLGELAAKPTERDLPLPLGDVAEQCEDGEGNL